MEPVGYVCILETYYKRLAKKRMESEKSNNVHKPGSPRELVVWFWFKSEDLRTQGTRL
ncbi:hypothetical protein STEG23_014253, partial [Scotinomys teguina]